MTKLCDCVQHVYRLCRGLLLLIGEDLCDGPVLIFGVALLLGDGGLFLDGGQGRQVHGGAHRGDSLERQAAIVC